MIIKTATTANPTTNLVLTFIIVAPEELDVLNQNAICIWKPPAVVSFIALLPTGLVSPLSRIEIHLRCPGLTLQSRSCS